ncbi:MAG: hypothetical protein ACTSU2_02785 [Promethearchaeota archaeon]
MAKIKNMISMIFANSNLGIYLIFASIGGISWALRGSSGWGGFDGALIPGMVFSLFLYYFFGNEYRMVPTNHTNREERSNRSQISDLGNYIRANPGAPFLLGLGVAIGGMWGYGIYVSWINGVFLTGLNDPSSNMTINPFIGYLGLFITGIDWLGVSGILFGWSSYRTYFKEKSILKYKMEDQLNDKNITINDISKLKVLFWLKKVVIPLIFVLMGIAIIKYFPNLIYPKYSKEFYSVTECPLCLDRIVSTNSVNFLVFMWWLGAIIESKISDDKITLRSGLVLGLGFGFIFMVCAMWNLMPAHTSNPNYIDWWKLWEIGAGFFGGILILRLYIIVSKQFKNILSNNVNNNENNNMNNENYEKDDENKSGHKELGRISFYSKFTAVILLLILIYGSSLKIGEFLGLYVVDQYEMSIARIVIIIIMLLIALFYHFIRSTKKEDGDLQRSAYNLKDLPGRVSFIDILILVYFIIIAACITIWPNRVIIIYAILGIIGIHFLFREYIRIFK